MGGFLCFCTFNCDILIHLMLHLQSCSAVSLALIQDGGLHISLYL